ncbi:MAG: 16S rRNA (adenine(1518)-N(6)/adenine(1519)-N(6))-dimethyltransferase RsmA [Terracidiphilus sp.]|nr:16S rRNA (adenine(1518)-N(6)/adenine(1519)-N(6))-dimethyltransferase RsmA [Terracidiphilus sp.]
MPPKSKLGQNFLHDQAAIRRIVAALGDCSHSTVVEIGPGRGAVTRQLLPTAAHLLAVEVDPELVLRLRAEFPPDKVRIVHQDVLAFDFAAAAAESSERLAVVGNLPYYITSPILLRLAANHAALDRAVLLMQREVADRIAAEPGSRDYGLLSVTVQMYGPVERLFTLPPEAFSPPPEVHSTVVRWRFAPRFTQLAVEETSFLDLVRKSFAQKRKTLANNLRAAGLEPELVSTVMDLAGIDAQARAEALSIEAFADLWKALRTTMHSAQSLAR